MRFSSVHVKAIHTLIFAVLSLCVVYLLYSALFDRITYWTWAALALLIIESIVLIAFGWTCPLTLLAERLGAESGAVADIYLPKWFADRIFPICGSLFLIACLVLLFRLLRW